ncbi:MAG TPA: TIGR03618 family F420-dependent PPOX class oxidoreductase [Actinomycetota bacterium]|jgi:PPOX class probable F420-dependent enzyme|nr:TIGR03618 family F420-dependent PPOX class oxidoreductase [Actinomycetota bacterium]
MAELIAEDVELLTGTDFATFVTMNRDGSPQATITWVDAADGHVLVNTAQGRVKDRNVRADPHVALMVMRAGDAYDWISITGTVVDIEVGDRAERHIDELSHRYDGHGYAYTPGQVREILKIRPDRIVRYRD